MDHKGQTQVTAARVVNIASRESLEYTQPLRDVDLTRRVSQYKTGPRVLLNHRLGVYFDAAFSASLTALRRSCRNAAAGLF